MATQKTGTPRKTPAKKKETNTKTALPTAAKAKASTKPPAKKSKSVAKAAPKTKTPANAAPKTAAAKRKTQSSVKPTKTQSTTKKTEPNKTKPSNTTANKTVAAAGSVSSNGEAAKKVARATRGGKTVAARRADEARPSKEKKEEAAQANAVNKEQKKPVPSETAKKVAKTLIRRKAAKKGESRKTKPARPIAFTLDEAIEIAKTKTEANEGEHTENGNGAKAKAPVPQKKEVTEEVKQENRVLGAASISDILGYNPNAGPKKEDENEVPPKFAKYYKLLLELREHVLSGLDIHTKETLKRSSKEDSGNLSAYSQHMADAGTDTFDRDFALSLVSSEQDALYEIEDAIRRIKRGSYGICEITGKPIKKERLLAVPFAKYSVEGQAEYERTHKKSAYRGGAFSDSSEEGVKFMDEDAEE